MGTSRLIPVFSRGDEGRDCVKIGEEALSARSEEVRGGLSSPRTIVGGNLELGLKFAVKSEGAKRGCLVRDGRSHIN